MSAAGPAGVSVRAIVLDVLRLYRRHWRLLVPLAVLVLVPQAIGDAFLGEIEIHHVDNAADLVKLAPVPLSVAVNLGGEALYSGVVAAVTVGWWQHGRGRPLLEIVASVRYLALIAVDVLIAIGTALGLVLLIVPGILFATYTYVAPVLIELQDVSIRRSFSKSLELVRGHFWPVLAIGLMFYAGTEAAVNALMLPFHGFAHEVGAHLAIESVFEPLQGIATVLVGLRLLELHGETPSSSLVRPLSPAAEPE